MTDLRKAAERLLEALEDGWVQHDDWVAFELRQALAQPETFKPDWDMIEPYHERIKELEIENERLLQALAQPWDTSDMAHRTGGINLEQEADEWYEKALWGEKQEPYSGKANQLNNDRMQIDPVTGDVSFGTPSKFWVSLTDEEVSQIYCDWLEYIKTKKDDNLRIFVLQVEANLKEKNT